MINRQIRFITEVGILSALGLALDFLGGVLSGFMWPAGGSISLVLVPIIVMAYRWGLKGGLLTGFIVGSIQIIWAGSGAVYPFQTVLDYVVAYTLVGLAGVFFKKIYSLEKEAKLYYINLGIFLGASLRTLVHIISGLIYFIDLSDGLMPAIVASSVYNLGYMVPTTILTFVVITLIAKKQPSLLFIEE